MKVVYLFLLFGLCSLASGAKILAFLTSASKSHQRFMQPLVKELAVRGHEVVLYTSYVAVSDLPANLKVVQLPDYTGLFLQMMNMNDTEKMEETFNGDDDVWFALTVNTFAYREMMLTFVEQMVQEDLVKELIASEQKFDLVIMEDFLQEPFAVLAHKFDAPSVYLLPTNNFLWTHYTHGSPYDTSYIAECLHNLTDRMTFLDRLFNTFTNMWYRLVWSVYYVPKFQKMADKYIRYPGWETRPSVMEQVANSSLFLFNADVATNYPYPYASHFKEVGGLHLQTPKPLPKDIKTFMDEAKNGVIYFTLGSAIDVSVKLKNLESALVKVFSEVKQRVLWKWEKAIPNLPKNVKIGHWFPQQDILRHKNCVMFMTHGGLLSMIEAMSAGVPTIGIPMFGDQMRNVRHAEHFGYGLKLFPRNLTEESIRWAINEILSNPDYTTNAKKRSEMFLDKPYTALETAVYWTEYVIRHKGAHHLKPAIVTMPWYQQAMIDVYGVMAAAVLIPLYIIYKFVKLICSCCCKQSSNKTKKKRE